MYLLCVAWQRCAKPAGKSPLASRIATFSSFLPAYYSYSGFLPARVRLENDDHEISVDMIMTSIVLDIT